LNKVAIVTGSSRGIGEAIALEFAMAGYSIVINSRNQDELSISKQEILKVAGSTTNVLEFPGDISQEQTCLGIVEAAIQNFGRIDVLVNNAGINGPEKKSQEIKSDEWDKVIDINLKGCFMCSREVIKQMLLQRERESASDYSIINIPSVHETTPMPLATPLQRAAWKC
jgi:NAD(P)-dependent dehydrogenase (short-subunit alcohol dehydrogenase family)